MEDNDNNTVRFRMKIYIFFFKQKTAYEILTCDWSSDVCSSDLLIDPRHLSFSRMSASRSPLRRTSVQQETHESEFADRKSVVQGKSVDLGGRRIIKKKNPPYD